VNVNNNRRYFEVIKVSFPRYKQQNLLLALTIGVEQLREMSRQKFRKLM